MKLKNLPWIPFAVLAIGIGFYPLVYYITDMRSQGLLQSKPRELVNNNFYLAIFYTHITFGGIALLTGWSQFSQRLRDKYLKTHRNIGTIYVTAVMFGGIAGLIIAFFASGGIVSVTGFGALASLWLFTIIKAYTAILKRDVAKHQKWMIRNYALTFAAVTLRLWLPLSQTVLHVDFIFAYRTISWLCWVPNLLVAEIIVRNRKTLDPVYNIA
jgi:uncharacterized membrane protein